MSATALPRSTRAASEPDPLLEPVRRSIWVLLILAVANAVFLYLFPRQAIHYAWPIKPPATAAMMGAGYVAGAAAAALGAFGARHWRSIRPLVPAFIALSVLMLLATVIHASRFRWSFALTWLWTAVYAVLPVAAALEWRMQVRAGSDTGPWPERPAALRLFGVVSVVCGAGLLAVGAALFVAPHGVIRHWPWHLTTLTSQVIAGWYVLAGTMLLVTGAGLRRWHELVIPYATAATWTALALPIPVFHAGVQTGRTAFVAWLAVNVALLVTSIAALVTAAGALSRPGEPGI